MKEQHRKEPTMNRMESGKTGGGLRVAWGAAHRNGVCEKCHEKFEDFDTGKKDERGHPIMVRLCPTCGGSLGELISRQTSIEPPRAPSCLTPGCLLAYIKRAMFYALLANYHARRVTYAEANRHKVILERYRTGEPSPKTMWQAIHANIKLACPMCRKYNVDPLLFDRR